MTDRRRFTDPGNAGPGPVPDDPMVCELPPLLTLAERELRRLSHRVYALEEAIRRHREVTKYAEQIGVGRSAGADYDLWELVDDHREIPAAGQDQQHG